MGRKAGEAPGLRGAGKSMACRRNGWTAGRLTICGEGRGRFCASNAGDISRNRLGKYQESPLIAHPNRCFRWIVHGGEAGRCRAFGALIQPAKAKWPDQGRCGGDLGLPQRRNAQISPLVSESPAFAGLRPCPAGFFKCRVFGFGRDSPFAGRGRSSAAWPSRFEWCEEAVSRRAARGGAAWERGMGAAFRRRTQAGGKAKRPRPEGRGCGPLKKRADRARRYRKGRM